MNVANVYFVQVGQGGPIKIGITKGPVEKRLHQLQKANARELRLLATIYDAHPAVEAHLLSEFHSGWIRGEWFKASTPGLLELIAEVKAGRTPDRLVEIVVAQRAHEAATA
jgi:hypothetical protein